MAAEKASDAESEKDVYHVAGFRIKLGDKPMEVAAQSPPMLEGVDASPMWSRDGQAFEDMIERNAEDNIESHLGGDDDNLLSVVLDAANIGRFGMEKGASDLHASFDTEQLMSAISYFERYKIRVVSFIPAAMVRKRPNRRDTDCSNARMDTNSKEDLDNLISNKRHRIVVVPSGDDDDMYVLNYSRQNNCFIVSNDFFNDHVERLRRRNQSLGSSMRLWIDENRCSYTFVGNREFMPNPSSSLWRAIEVLENTRDDTTTALRHAVQDLDKAISTISTVRTEASLLALALALQARAELHLDANDEEAAWGDVQRVRGLVQTSQQGSHQQVGLLNAHCNYISDTISSSQTNNNITALIYACRLVACPF